MNIRWTKWVPVVLLFLSCSPELLYDTYKPAPVTGWARNDTLSFEVPKMMEDGTYDLTLGLRTNGEYPFTSLTLIVEQTILPEDNSYNDTIHCELVNQKGQELGNGVSYFQYLFPIRKESLKAGDSLRVNVRHDMKKEDLPGINDVGLEIRRISSLRTAH